MGARWLTFGFTAASLMGCVCVSCELASGVGDFAVEPAAGGAAASGSSSASGGDPTATATVAGTGGAASLPIDCLAIIEADPAAADGTYTIDPDGAASAPAMEVACDMTTEGGGWTRFNWLSGPAPPVGTDPLGRQLHECNVADDNCLARIPGAAMPTELLVWDLSAGRYAAWRFNGGEVSNAMLAAMRDKQTTCLLDAAPFQPYVSNSSESYCGNGAEGGCDSFMYANSGCSSEDGQWALELDGDLYWCAAAFKLGSVPHSCGYDPGFDHGYLNDCDCNDESGALYYR